MRFSLCPMRTERLTPDDPRLADVLDLIRRAFAEHDGRIDPPSSMHRLTLANLADAADIGELWVFGIPVCACVILSAREATLNLSKLAVAPDKRGNGLARRLVATAEDRARLMGLTALELQTRIELTENHAAFQALGFGRIGESAHPGYDRPTSITMRKPL
jgi:GNAT superfamily N-acetyltransferase